MMMKKKKGGGGGAGREAEGEERRGPKTTTTEKKKKKKKKGDAPDESAAAAAVVLGVELHCDGCAMKVRKAIRGAQGAESVRTDVAAGTVTVAGKPDPWDLRERIQAKLGIAIDIAFVSPANPPKPKEEKKGNKNKDKDGDAKNKKKNNKQMQPAPESTVVLNIQLHCEGCTDRIKRKASSIKGVKQVTVDTAKEQVTVRGTMDANSLPDVLRAKLKPQAVKVTAVRAAAGGPGQPMVTNKDKKAGTAGCDNHDDSREQEEDEAAGDNSSSSSAAAKKKNKNWKQQQPRGDDEAAGAGEMASSSPWTIMSEEEQQQYSMIFPGPASSYGRGSASAYRVELLQGPQLFSDENPNACSLM